jgi:hypothetical protein
MTEQFAEFEQLQKTQGTAAAVDHLLATLREAKRFHPLFDAQLLKKKHLLGLPLTRPTAFDDVPAEHREEFEQAYIAAARQTGELLLQEGMIRDAWIYLRTIREPEKIAAAIEALPVDGNVDEEILEIAFFQGVAPVKGLQMLLRAHGTCSTITAFDQHSSQLPPDLRQQCAAVLVREIYHSLRETVQMEVQRRQPMLPPGQSLQELIAGRDWLLADDNYHIDVSHLNAVVRFARSLEMQAPELRLAVQLALYGSRLSTRYQYAGNPPFEDFYPAHLQYFHVLLDEDREAGLDYFRQKLGDPKETSSQLAAVALVDLLTRLNRQGEAAEIAARYLGEVGEEFGLSVAELCAAAGRYDLLREAARSRDDLVGFAAAVISQSKSLPDNAS